jgi:hypothetical protein
VTLNQSVNIMSKKNQNAAPLLPGLAKLMGKSTFSDSTKYTDPEPYPNIKAASSTTRPTKINLPPDGSGWETEEPDTKMLDQLKTKMKAVTISRGVVHPTGRGVRGDEGGHDQPWGRSPHGPWGRGVNDEEIDNDNDQRVRLALDNLTAEVEGCNTREMRVINDSPYMENDESGNPKVKHGGRLSTIDHDKYQLLFSSKRKAVSLLLTTPEMIFGGLMSHHHFPYK